jgi:DNA-binding response OmpR family regulator
MPEVGMVNGDVIVVVEDDEVVRSLVRMALEEEGYEVLTAENGQSALALVSQRTPILILLDLWMPVLDGWEFVRAYRARTDGTAPIVALTTAVDNELRRHELPVDEVLTKPFEVSELYAIVSRYAKGENKSFSG